MLGLGIALSLTFMHSEWPRLLSFGYSQCSRLNVAGYGIVLLPHGLACNWSGKFPTLAPLDLPQNEWYKLEWLLKDAATLKKPSRDFPRPDLGPNNGPFPIQK